MNTDNPLFSKEILDREWLEMCRKYIERVPSPAYKESPPIKTSLEAQIDHEEQEEHEDEDTRGA